jgi:hypothetical protein
MAFFLCVAVFMQLLLSQVKRQLLEKEKSDLFMGVDERVQRMVLCI